MVFKQIENINILCLSYSNLELGPVELLRQIKEITQVKWFMIGQYVSEKKNCYNYEVILCVEDLPYRKLVVKDLPLPADHVLYSKRPRWNVPLFSERRKGWEDARILTHKELILLFTNTDTYFTNIKPPFFLGVWLFCVRCFYYRKKNPLYFYHRSKR